MEHKKSLVFISPSFHFPLIQKPLFWKFWKSLNFIIHLIVREKKDWGKKEKKKKSETFETKPGSLHTVSKVLFSNII